MVASDGVTMAAGASRGVGELDVLEEVLPGWVAGAMGVLTELGGFAFLSVLLGVCYWRFPTDRESVVALFGTALGGVGLYRGLKHAFEYPRPDIVPVDPASVPAILRPLYEDAIVASGYGFPSGHATNATIIYAGLALALTLGTRRQRIAGAAVMIALVCFTRLAIGVHYLVDVLGGIPTGFTALIVLFVLPKRYLPERRVAVTLAGVFPLAGLYYLTSGGNLTAVLLACVALATLVAWLALGRGSVAD